jgi:hypothetical protein
MFVADQVSGLVDSGDPRRGQASAALLTSLVGEPAVKTKVAQIHAGNLSETGWLAKCALSALTLAVASGRNPDGPACCARGSRRCQREFG